MPRITNSSLGVWDPANRADVTIGPGCLLTGCQIRRRSQSEVDAGTDVYDVEFQTGGRQYVCALFRFQPRTDHVEA